MSETREGMVSHRSADRFGVPVTAADAAVLAAYDEALTNTLTFQGAPLDDLERVIVAEPRFLMAHVLKAVLYGMSTDKALSPQAQAAVDQATGLASAAGERERGHVRAIQTWLAGRFAEAADIWESILVDHPNDALALFAAHQSDFLLGRSSELRDRVARRLPDVDRGSALEGFYLGMHAFGLEEMGDYDAALDAGHRAVARDASDAWAIHAVAHVHEMTNELRAGEAWLSAHAGGYSTGTLAVHLAWHRALYHHDERHWRQALELYDHEMRRPAPGVMELVDASSLLWRLTLHEIDVGKRWLPLAEAWQPRSDDSCYVFNDMHAMMAFAAAGHVDLAERLLTVMSQTAQSPGENAAVTREIGLPVAKALFAYSQKRYAEAVVLLAPVRDRAVTSGGSHAQRDVLGLTLLSAAERAGKRALARALLNERLALRPRSVLNQHWMSRVRAST